jgi:uncharacterized SAM-binding protein YcdF (DUF218 family)
MSTPFNVVLESLAFPPGNVLLLGLLATLVLRRTARRVAIAAAFVLLYLESTPATVAAFVAPLERYAPLMLDRLPPADAIVVLAGGRYSDAPEYGRDSVSEQSLMRLQYAADIERASGLPLVITGGSVQGEPDTEAAMMADVLRGTFGVSREIVIETRSRNTAENALFTKEVLDAHGWRRVLLVTHVQHMPRSVAMFEKAGVEVIPAPLRYMAHHRGSPLLLGDWLPDAKALRQFREAAHEYVGMLWYRLRY